MHGASGPMGHLECLFIGPLVPLKGAKGPDTLNPIGFPIIQSGGASGTSIFHVGPGPLRGP